MIMIKRLSIYYEDHGISPVDFDCRWRRSCADGSPKFTEAKVSYVGPGYEEGELPRLLFLSLDSGSGREDPLERTAEAVRARELERNLATLHKNQHWPRTHEMAHTLLRQFQPGLELDDARLHFAHVNSAKCCQNHPSRKQAQEVLFRNCRRFIPDELRLLQPDVIVTQGKQAAKVITDCFDVRRDPPRSIDVPGYKCKASYETGIVEMGSEPWDTLWLKTYHPSNHGSFHPQREYCWPLYAQAVGEFWQRQAQRARRS